MQQYPLVKDDVLDDGPAQWSRIADIPGFPVDSFADLQRAIADKKYRLGVDPLAAARWSEQFSGRHKTLFIKALSVLLILAAAASAVAALWTRDYWLLAAPPIMALSFYVSHPSSRFAKWVTIAGAVSVVAFFNLLLNELIEAATLVAYAGLTFAAVRAAAYVNNSSFRKALTSDESLFVIAYQNGACSLRKGKGGMVYAHGVAVKE